MSFANGALLLEFAIRIGFDDIARTPALRRELFLLPSAEAQGPSLGQTREPLLMDEFQARLRAIPPRAAEVGKDTPWRNSFLSLEEIEQFLAEANMKIVHGFPRTHEDLPCISIRLGSESNEDYIGEILEDEEREEGTFRVLGSEWDTSYAVSIVTASEMDLQIWYTVLKYAFMRYKQHLEAYGLKNLSQAWGDVEPASEYLQSGLFIYQRDCAIHCTKTEFFGVPVQGFDEATPRRKHKHEKIDE